MFARTILFFGATIFCGIQRLPAQTPTPAPDPVRVTVSVNADGTRTTYEFDAPRRRAVATTTSKTGALVGRIRYVLDEMGRFYSGEVYGPNDLFRFKTLYMYDDAGRLAQETQLGADDAVRNKIVYAYDALGRQTGYSVYDAAGKLIRKTPGIAPRSTRPPTRSTPTNQRK
jgi:YD repeat-containing protein